MTNDPIFDDLLAAARAGLISSNTLRVYALNGDLLGTIRRMCADAKRRDEILAKFEACDRERFEQLYR